MRRMLITLVLLGCAAPRSPAPVAPTQRDAGVVATPDVEVDAALPALALDAGMHCAVLCGVCADALSNDAGDCLSRCAQLLSSIGGDVDPVCVGYAADCEAAVRCIF